MRGLMDKNGEQFAYLEGDLLFTMEDEPTGRLQEGFIVDLAGNKVWRVVGDAVYTLDGNESVGYFSSESPRDY